jgi:hypothetical protein
VPRGDFIDFIILFDRFDRQQQLFRRLRNLLGERTFSELLERRDVASRSGGRGPPEPSASSTCAMIAVVERGV